MSNSRLQNRLLLSPRTRRRIRAVNSQPRAAIARLTVRSKARRSATSLFALGTAMIAMLRSEHARPEDGIYLQVATAQAFLSARSYLPLSVDPVGVGRSNTSWSGKVVRGSNRLDKADEVASCAGPTDVAWCRSDSSDARLFPIHGPNTSRSSTNRKHLGQCWTIVTSEVQLFRCSSDCAVGRRSVTTKARAQRQLQVA